jgi:DNA-binding response OmpR family regulator
MKVLIVQPNDSAGREIAEFLNTPDWSLTRATNRDEALHALSAGTFDLALLSVQRLEDLGLLLHLNRYYPKLRVIASAMPGVADLLAALPTARFELLSEPYRLSSLERLLQPSESEVTH